MIILFLIARSVLWITHAGFASASWIGTAADFVTRRLPVQSPRDGAYAPEIAVATALLMIGGALSAAGWLAWGIRHLRQAESKKIEIVGRMTNGRRLAIALQISVVLSLLSVLPAILSALEVRLQFLGLLAAGCVLFLVVMSRWRSYRSAAVNTVGPWIVAGLIGLGGLSLLWRYREYAVWILLASLAVSFLMHLVTNINRTSLFYFYRDRLSKAFIIKRAIGKRDPVPNDDMLLREVEGWKSGWPYHILNATINVSTVEAAKAGRRRPADFFMMSPWFCGSTVTSFVSTRKFENDDFTLAGAMAVSGAATNPQYGLRTRPALAFLLGLVNARLGVWVRLRNSPRNKHRESDSGRAICFESGCLRQDRICSSTCRMADTSRVSACTSCYGGAAGSSLSPTLAPTPMDCSGTLAIWLRPQESNWEFWSSYQSITFVR